jgi:hypothetical protein
VVVFAISLPGDGEGLTWESAGNNVNCPGEVAAVKFSNVVESLSIREIFFPKRGGKTGQFQPEKHCPNPFGMLPSRNHRCL